VIGYLKKLAKTNYICLNKRKTMKCRSCNSVYLKKIFTTPALPLYFWPSNTNEKKGKCQIYFCKRCSIYQTQKFSTSMIKSFYGNRSFNIENTIDKKKRLKNIIQNYGKEFFNNKNILDIGGGINDFASLIKNRSNIVSILDFKISVKAKKNSDKQYKLNFENTRLKKSSYDIILLFHTLEHFLHPNKVLLKIKEILKPDGVLLVEVPNIEYYINNLFYYSFFHQHLTMFNEKSLKNVLNFSGFRQLKKMSLKKDIVLCSYKIDSLKKYKKKKIFKEKLLSKFKKKYLLFKKKIKLIIDKNEKIIFFGAGGSAALFLSYFPELKKKI